MTPLKTSPLNPTVEPLDVNIYTDGSLQKQYPNMGAASISIEPNGTETILKTPVTGSRNSTRPELVAIIEALASWPSNANITIFTDSQTSIHTFERLQSSKILPFKFAHKYSNSSINRLLHHVLHQRDGNTKLIKVAAHTGIILNERVDKFAKQAVSLNYSTALYNYLPETPQALSYIFHNNWMYDMNPKILVKKLYDQCHIKSIKNHVSTKLKIKDEVDMKLTCRILSSREFGQRTLSLKENSFRLKLFSNLLPLNHRISRKRATQYCLRCTQNEIETLDHFLKCEDNHCIEEEMQMKTIELMHKHLEETPFHANLVQILNKCQLLREGCLNNPLSKGIITKALKTHIKNSFKIKSHDCNILLALVVDAWLCSLQEIAWKRRNIKNAKEKQNIQIRDMPVIPHKGSIPNLNIDQISHDQILLELFDIPLPIQPLHKRPISNYHDEPSKRLRKDEDENQPRHSPKSVSKRLSSQDADDPAPKRQRTSRAVL